MTTLAGFGWLAGLSASVDRLDRSNTQSDQMMQNIMNAIDFQVGCTSHHCATKAVGTPKMTDLTAIFTEKRANDPSAAGP